ncbi:MAG TPA: hypothetical protein VF021_00295, partial [Longimicrobiales bacterium]
IKPAITQNFTESAQIITGLVQEHVNGLGLLGKTRKYEAFINAMDQVAPSQPVNFLPQLKDSMKATMTLQQAFQQTQVSTPGGADSEIALQAFSNTAVRAGSEVAGVGSQVQQVQQQVQQVQTTFDQQVQALSQTVSAIGGRMDATLAEGGHIQRLNSDLKVVQNQVAALGMLAQEPTQVVAQIQQIGSIRADVDRLLARP